MQYPVPQFQDIEDKIIGPLTFKQFIYLLGGAGASYAILQTFPKGLSYILIAPIAGLSLALAFYRVNNQPFINIIESAFYYLLRNKLYLWSHKKKYKKDQVVQPNTATPVEVPNISESKMKDLAWSLDINENVERAEQAQSITTQNVLNSI